MRSFMNNDRSEMQRLTDSQLYRSCEKQEV